jgi:hypothetical protein
MRAEAKLDRRVALKNVVSGENVVGKTINHLTIITELDRVGGVDSKTGWRTSKRFFLCKCVCGLEKRVSANEIFTGGTKSCGCIKGESRKRHGMSGKPEYYTWSLMKRRCDSPKDDMYKYYGGAGVKYCDRWALFDNFYADMGPRPSSSHSLDRFPNGSGDYCKENCRWATHKEQANNMKSNVILDFRGEKLTMKQVSERLGIKYTSLIERLKNGWDMEKIINTPIKKTKRRSK